MTIRVLVCDDVEDVRVVVRLGLELDPDVEVVGQAENGREAIDQAERLQPDIVLLDLVMPVIDGLQALPEIRRVSPRSKVVVLSALDREAMEQQARDLGAVRYIEKTAGARMIARTVREVVEEEGAAS